MGIKEILLASESKKGKYFFKKVLKWLDNSKRLKFNNPDKLIRASGIHPGQKVLEIGCGSGFFTVAASKMLASEDRLISIDIHPLAVEETQKKVDQLGLKNVIVKKDDAMNLSFGDSMFDLVLIYGVVPAPVISMKSLTREVYRVLEPGGICAIWAPVPFWSPRVALKYASFKPENRINGVFRMRKE